MNKRGSYIVFITLIFAGILIFIYAVIYAAGEKAIDSTVYHFGRIWGRSILAEYDTCLKDRYGLFGFYGDKLMVEKKIDFYAAYSAKNKKYIRYEGSSCNLEDYHLTEKSVFMKQVKDITLTVSKPKPLYAPRGEEPELKETGNSNRYISNQSIINGLPSKGKADNIDISALAETIKQGKSLEMITDSGFLMRYITVYFRNHFENKNVGDTFFENEWEYIICGKTDDKKCLDNVYWKLIALRNILNLYYLYTCPEKKEAALVLANAITPGPEAIITQAVILEVWAFAEAKNDLKLLYDSKTVPLIKGDSNWALSIENALEMNGSDDNEADKKKKYISPQKVEGQIYSEYLLILLTLLPEDTRILRTMDLIQINMKYLYCDYFLLSDYFTGLKYEIKVNGRKTQFEEEY